MEFFEYIWALLEHHGNVAWKYKDEALRVWQTFNLDEKRFIYAGIKKKLATGQFVSYIPSKAIEENAPRNAKQKTLSYNDYYAKFGTDLELYGWKRVFLPDEQKTIYVK